MRTEQLELLRLQNMEAGGFGPHVMMQIKVCQNCGSIGSISQSFCKDCGHRLPEHSLYQRYKEIHRCCPTCDTVLANSAQYCPQCGAKIRCGKP